MTFQETLAEHLAAIENRDLERFAATLCRPADALTLILPTGRMISGRDHVLEFHRTWFADPDWRLRAETLQIHEGVDTAYALLKVEYSDIDGNGVHFTKAYYLNLIFAHRHGRWGLIHDQNTFC